VLINKETSSAQSDLKITMGRQQISPGETRKLKGGNSTNFGFFRFYPEMVCFNDKFQNFKVATLLSL